ncbi:MAG TPA: DMT family transporter [Bauldia sp.]|nr:DMT family transporter [Bauldia sp.]
MTRPARSPAESAARLRGIALMCLAMLLFSVLDTAAKYVSQYMPSLEVVWARYAVSLAFAVAVLRPWANLADYTVRRPFIQALRGLFLLGSTILNFLALRYLQLAETAAIAFAAPFFIVGLAGPVLGEWAGPRRWAAAVIGFVGVIIVVQPGPDTFQPAALLSLGAACCYAGYNLTTRLLATTESPAGMLIYPAALATALLTPPLPFVGTLPPDWLVGALMLLTGAAGGLGHWFLIVAHRRAPASLLAPFQYTQILWMPVFGFLVFSDVPTRNTLIGAAIIVASGLYILYRERVHHDR